MTSRTFLTIEDENDDDENDEDDPIIATATATGDATATATATDDGASGSVTVTGEDDAESENDDTDGDGYDTDVNTDHDGTDSDGVYTPYTDYDGTDSDGVDTPTPTDNDGIDRTEAGAEIEQKDADGANNQSIFDLDADYTILTSYGSMTQIDLSEYLAKGMTGITLSLQSCDDSSGDYYDSATVQGGKLVLQTNTLGHVHGPNTQSETVCTVTANGGNGSEAREFSLYLVSDRMPSPMHPGALSLVEARANEADVQISAPEGSYNYHRLACRKLGEQPGFAVAYSVTNGTVLTIKGLNSAGEYEIRAYWMTRQSFDLYRAGNSGESGVLISECSPASEGIRNLAEVVSARAR